MPKFKPKSDPVKADPPPDIRTFGYRLQFVGESLMCDSCKALKTVTRDSGPVDMVIVDRDGEVVGTYDAPCFAKENAEEAG